MNHYDRVKLLKAKHFMDQAQDMIKHLLDNETSIAEEKTIQTEVDGGPHLNYTQSEIKAFSTGRIKSGGEPNVSNTPQSSRRWESGVNTPQHITIRGNRMDSGLEEANIPRNILEGNLDFKSHLAFAKWLQQEGHISQETDLDYITRHYFNED